MADDSDLTIMQLLQATNRLTDTAHGQSGFASIYDGDGDGVIDSSEASLRRMANDIDGSINDQGGI